MSNRLGAAPSVVPTRQVTECGVGGGSNWELLWELPAFPLTEQFGPFAENTPTFNQSLLMERDSGHFQLGTQVDEGFLYTPQTYSYETDLSRPKLENETRIFLDFAEEAMSANETSLDGSFLLEFGSNNLQLGERLGPRSGNFWAVDPILSEDGDFPRNVKVSATTVEEFLAQSNENFDLVIARHTLEHISNPARLLSELRDRLRPNGVVVLEFPDFGAILSKLRLDAVFHQHYHYFDESSVRRLASEAGFRIARLSRNKQGSNGGSLLVALSKGSPEDELPPIEADTRVSRVRNIIRNFETQMGVVRETIADGFWVGYGAGLMLPTLNYHLGGSVEAMGRIVDDSPVSRLRSYANLKLELTDPGAIDFENTSVLITSLENSRAIAQRAFSLGAERVIAPNGIY